MFKRHHSEPINTRNVNATQNNPFEILAEDHAKDGSEKDEEEEREVVKAMKHK